MMQSIKKIIFLHAERFVLRARVLLIMVLISVLFAEGQIAPPVGVAFQKVFGDIGAASPNDFASVVRQTADGGYIFIGKTSSWSAGGGGEIYVVKTDDKGDTLWTQVYGGTGTDDGDDIQQTTDGGYIITGNTSSFSAGIWRDVYLLKITSTGVVQWSRAYGKAGETDYGMSVQQTIDGGYVVGGYTRSYGAGDYDMYLIKTDVNGDTLWTKTYGGTGKDRCYSVQQTTDTGFVLVGVTESYGVDPLNSYDVYVVKTDANGDTLWTKTYGGIWGDYGQDIKLTTDGGYIILFQQ